MTSEKTSRLGLGRRLQRARRLIRRGGFSNFDEERILRDLVAELLPADHARTAVDIGAGGGVKSSNTYAFFLDGWRGLGVEYDARRARRLARAYKYLPGVEALRAQVTPENVVDILRDYGIEPDFSLLSLDIDSYDFWVLDAVLEQFSPRLIVTEINEKIPPPISFAVKFDPDFRLTHHFFGYSAARLDELCARHDYSLVRIEYNNAFLAARELRGVRPLTADEAYRRGYLERADRRERFPQNDDVEVLHTLGPEEGVEFLKRFYAAHEGKYEIGVAAPARLEASLL